MAKGTNNGANLGFESELWRAADALYEPLDSHATTNSKKSGR